MVDKALMLGAVVLVEARRVKRALDDDYKYGTSRNTTEAGVGLIASGYGAMHGFKAGAAVGTFFLGPYGTIIGGGVGALCGCFAYSYIGRELAGRVFDERKYNIECFTCQECGIKYECRIYTSQSRTHCPQCEVDEYRDGKYKKYFKCKYCDSKYERSGDDESYYCPRCDDDYDSYNYKMNKYDTENYECGRCGRRVQKRTYRNGSSRYYDMSGYKERELNCMCSSCSGCNLKKTYDDDDDDGFFESSKSKCNCSSCRNRRSSCYCGQCY